MCSKVFVDLCSEETRGKSPPIKEVQNDSSKDKRKF